jgi:hypothetical protein
MNLKYHVTDTEQIIASSVETGVTNDVTSFCSFRRRTATTIDPDNQYVVVDDAGSADIICPSPVSGETIYVDEITIANPDTISRTITVYWTNQTLFSLLWSGVLAPDEKVVYMRETGWQKINANGDPIVIATTITPVLNRRYLISGALAETFDRNLCNEVNTAVLSSGRLSGQAIWLEAGMTISSISFHSATTAAGTPTNQLFGLYDSSRNLLRSSTNNTTTAWAANSLKTLALTSTFTTTYSGLYYLGIMVTATTVPTLKGNTARVGGQLQAQAPSMGGTSNTGLTTALPATANAFGTVTTSFWGCVS